MSEEQLSTGPAADGMPETGQMGRRPRKWLLWTGLGIVVVILIAAAFVGGRLLGQQRLVGPAGMVSIRMELPADVPQEPPAAAGFVSKIEGKVVVVEEMSGGAGGGVMVVSGGEGGQQQVVGGPGQGDTKPVEVVITNDTKFYKTIPPSQEEMQGGGTLQMQVEEAGFEDLQSGQMLQVWGEKSGGRVTAEVVVINEPVTNMGVAP